MKRYRRTHEPPTIIAKDDPLGISADDFDTLYDKADEAAHAFEAEEETTQVTSPSESYGVGTVETDEAIGLGGNS